ncbi:energy transducer TonB [Sandaracinus amylolyticus]|uniref:energy transducer TonB n=1 Tax=Sandaracinus amylolyticus TaxID=927083 RepID=UPI001F1CF4AC|nr:hypothetical protein [Sandaracinus amylolyticus]UJR86670.1 Hypothetical protein I5071_87710 [Sandaracinus amylolyticus]
MLGALALGAIATANAQDAAPAATSEGDHAQHRVFSIVVDAAEGLTPREVGWALGWAVPELNARCAGPGPVLESHPLALSVDARGRVTIATYDGPSAACVRGALAGARFPHGHPATVRVTLSVLAPLVGFGSIGGSGSGSGVAWQGPLRPRDLEPFVACRRGGREIAYDVQVTVDASGAVSDARAIRPSGRAAVCVVDTLRASRFSAPRDAAPATFRATLVIGPPLRLGGGGFGGGGHIGGP